jgi:hypothetical protein
VKQTGLSRSPDQVPAAWPETCVAMPEQGYLNAPQRTLNGPFICHLAGCRGYASGP